MAKNYKKRTAEEIRQETKELTEQALESVEKFTKSPESIKELMDFMSRFPERSFRNQMLIQKQFPGAQACLGAAALKKNNIYIKKGEKGSKIFVRKSVKGFYDKSRGFVREAYATKEDKQKIEQGKIKIEKKPYYSIEKVFDITQTQLKPEDYPKIFPSRVFDFQLDGNGKFELKQGIDALAKEMNISIKDMREGTVFRGELGTAKGAYVRNPDTSQEEIVLNSRNTQTENLATSIHELAHAKMHKFSEYDTAIEELQAEMTSYIVTKHFGLDTTESSIPYIARWTNNGEEINAMEPAERGKILNDVSRVANQFIHTISTEINQHREISIEREKTLEEKTMDLESLENTSEANLFWYELDLRPVGIWTHPNSKENPPIVDSSFNNTKGKAYGAVGYKKAISKLDLENYDLSYLGLAETAEEAKLIGPKSSMEHQQLEVGQILYRVQRATEKKVNELVKITSIEDQGVQVEWLKKEGVKGNYQREDKLSSDIYPQEFFLNEWQYGRKTHENIYNKAISSFKEVSAANEVPLDSTVWINPNTGEVSQEDTGRSLPLKEGKYIHGQDQVQLMGKVFNREVESSMTTKQFFDGDAFKFPKERINEIQNERKKLVLAEQQKQMERA